MIPELGLLCLIIALGVALVQAIVPLLGAILRIPAWIRIARPAAYTQFVFVGGAFLILAYSFIVSDFSVLYVANNSNTHMPLIYRISAVWGAHEGCYRCGQRQSPALATTCPMSLPHASFRSWA